MQILDAGAFIAAERNDRAMWRRINTALKAGRRPLTSAAVLGQVWRGDARQATMARLIKSVEVAPLTEQIGLKIGRLLADSKTSDVVDAAVVILAADDDIIYTSDPDDIAHLAIALGLHVDIVPV